VRAAPALTNFQGPSPEKFVARGAPEGNTVCEHVRDRLPFAFEDLGEHQVKNIARPVRVYRVQEETAEEGASPENW